MSPRRETSRRLRDPAHTRERLVQAAFREVYKTGFQSAGIDTILAATDVTKGALYHHFASKEALGYAVVEEIVAKQHSVTWLRPLSGTGDPVRILVGIVQKTSLRKEDIEGGCPLLNLAQEMSPLDEGFRKRLETIFDAWQQGIATALRRGQSQGTVRRNVVPEEAASFLIAMFEGYVSLAKNAQDADVLKVGIKNILGWLRSLRPARQSPGTGRRLSRPVVSRQRGSS